MFNRIEYYYMLGIYKEKHIKKLLEAGVITEGQYCCIINGGA